MMSTFDPHAERLWSSEEDKQLRNAVFQEKEQKRPVKWDAIAASLPRRSKKECRKRWHHTMMEAVRKCKWKPEEDERLSTAVRKFGRKWISVAQVVMTRNDNECMRRWKELQAKNANTTPSSPNSMWSLDELNQAQGHPQHASISSSASSTTGYSSSAASYVEDLLRGMGQMSPQSTCTQFDNIESEPLNMRSVSASTSLADSRGPEIHQDLDAFIDFDAERPGNFFEPRYDSDGHQSDSSEWSWFDSMMTGATNHGNRPQYNNDGLSVGSGGFMIDNNPGELMHDSPGALDSSYSSTRSNSVVPQMQPQISAAQSPDPYNQDRNLLSLKSSGTGGVKVVIVCKSNDLRTLSSLERIMKSLKANGHSVIQDSHPIGANDYLCGSLGYDDVLQDLVGTCS